MEDLRAAAVCFLLLVVCIQAADHTEDDYEHPCFLPPNPGYCKGVLFRYYFSQQTKTCQPFIYGGCGGNENNFENRKSCLAVCFEDDKCNLPAQPGPCKQSLTRYYFDPDTKSCEKFIYGGCHGNVNNFVSEQECNEACKHEEATCQAPTDKCELPPEMGDCTRFVPRFYYNPKVAKCQMFIYGGCGGNDNRFKTVQECRQLCLDGGFPCVMPVDPGKCDGHHPRFFYNKTSEKCEPFIYTGCGGNPNKFNTIKKCEELCYPDETCSLPADPGKCKGKLTRYFYNATSRRCEQFNYSGCEGNNNNFNTKDDCEEECKEEAE